MRHHRVVLTRTTAAAIVAVGLAVVAAMVLAVGGDEPDARPPEPRPGLRLYGMEGKGGAQLIVFLPSELLHPTLAPQNNRIRFECFDRSGRALLRVLRPWVVEPSEFRLLHFHQPLDNRQTLNRIDRCRVTGTDPALEGSAKGMSISKAHPPYPLVDAAGEGLAPGE